jgi:hypothetical protein
VSNNCREKHSQKISKKMPKHVRWNWKDAIPREDQGECLGAFPLKISKKSNRFILGMDSNAILARIYDGEICPEVGTKIFIHQLNYLAIFTEQLQICVHFTSYNMQPSVDNATPNVPS